MSTKQAALAAIIGAVFMNGCARPHNETEKQFCGVRDGYIAKYQPLQTTTDQAWWDANTSGDPAAFKRQEEAKGKLVELHTDKAMFAQLKTFKEGGKVQDPLLKRELLMMYDAFLAGQVDETLQKKIVTLETEVEQIFNTHRSQVDGKALTENDVREVLSKTKNSAEAEKAWKGYMDVGTKVDAKLHETVKLRNETARQLGYRDFYAMQLDLQEIDEKELIKLFEELDNLTRQPFADLKSQIDDAMAKRFGIPASELRPWHYGDLFFQEAPDVEEVNLDTIYTKQDLLQLAKTYYESMGMETDGILSRSDLYEKPGKSPHAFSTNIDRAQNIRVLCNIRPDSRWADTLLHELGHAVYDQYTRPDVPYLLHTPSHSLTTEGYANMMGAMSKNRQFLADVVKLPPDEAKRYGDAAQKSLRTEKLIFSRWAQVMVRFEMGMYQNPDQDLGKLWWDLKKKYQLLNPPETVSRPDYGAKIHIVTAPVYYHSYLMGDLFSCQVQHEIATKILGVKDPRSTCFYGSKAAGNFLKDKIFGPGNLYSWNDLTKRATGEPLTAKYFASQYVNQ